MVPSQLLLLPEKRERKKRPSVEVTFKDGKKRGVGGRGGGGGGGGGRGVSQLVRSKSVRRKEWMDGWTGMMMVFGSGRWPPPPPL